MSDHDDLCPIARGVGPTGCHCDLIAKVRADEREDADRRVDRQLLAMVHRLEEQRERIAQAIEACRAAWNDDWPGLAAAGATVGPGTVRVTYDECARIARSGGSDE